LEESNCYIDRLNIDLQDMKQRWDIFMESCPF